ncbi:membrane protein [Rhizoctonia solani]|uniref:Membrane protein n=1 Tax=Rhizoctonia solani TaxID=456999 RepID=A0A8H8NXN2_9AGAM|nr:uncharacterized protein RhiXN_06818 [Rhizoctonia solani]QRW21829.1 membrane protein [Rhizoctonia solani]
MAMVLHYYRGHNSGYRRRILHVVSRFAGHRLVPHPEERAMAIERIKVNQTGVENKVWKKDQSVDRLQDLVVCSVLVPRNHSKFLNKSTKHNYKLVWFFNSSNDTLGVRGRRRRDNNNLHRSPAGFKVERRARICGCSVLCAKHIGFGPDEYTTMVKPNWSPILIVDHWGRNYRVRTFTRMVDSCRRGAYKEDHAIMLSAYCVGNLVGPQMWQEKYKPRNRIPWAVITICYVLCPITLLSLRFLLARENQRRDAEPNEDDMGEVYIEEVLVDGTKIERRVDKAFLDLTDIQNREFRYVL